MPRGAPAPGPPSSFFTKHAPLFLFTAVFAAYGNTLAGGFVWDDHILIVNNPALALPGGAWSYFTSDFWSIEGVHRIASGYYRPLTMLSYALDNSLYGLLPAGFHLTNLILHLMASLLAYHIALILLAHRRAALTASLFFAVLPIHSEAVAWISGRTDLLSGVFYFLTLLILLTRKLRWRHHLGAGLTCLAALLAKEMAVTLPLTAAVILYWRAIRHDEAKPLRQALLGAIGPAAALGLYLAMRGVALGGLFSGAVNWEDLLYTYPRGLALYSLKALAPLSLNADYAFLPGPDAWFYLGLLLLGLLAAVTIWARRWLKTAGLPILFLLITLLPVSGIVPIHRPIAERFAYIPSLALCLLLGLLALAMKGAAKQSRVRGLPGGDHQNRLEEMPGPVPGAGNWPRSLPAFLFIPLLLLHITSTIIRNITWNNDLALFKDSAGKNPPTSANVLNLASAQLSRGMFAEAEETTARFISLFPRHGMPYYLAALARISRSNPREAPALLERARALGVALHLVENAHGLLALNQGRLLHAAGHFQAALKAAPNDAETHLNLIRCNLRQEAFEAAAHTACRLLRLKPNHYPAYAMLAEALALGGHPGLAAEVLHLKRQVKHLSRSHLARGWLKVSKGRPEEGAREMMGALGSPVDRADALAAISRAFAVAGKPKLACRYAFLRLKEEPLNRTVKARLAAMPCPKAPNP